MVIGAKGRAYKKAVALACSQLPLLDRDRLPVVGKVAVDATLISPDNRRRDLDNFCGKALLDALKGIAFGDDSLVYRLSGRWSVSESMEKTVTKGGLLFVEITPL